MKIFFSVVEGAVIVVWITALYLLWADPRPASFWALMLLSMPTAMYISIFFYNFPKMWEHPQFPRDYDKVADDILGSPRVWRPYRSLMTGADLLGGAYMIVSGMGLTGCGEVFVAVTLLQQFRRWLDKSPA